MTVQFERGASLFLLNLAIGLGTFIQILDTSIANVAIPYIAGNLSVSADQGTWVITSFAASNAIVLPLTGWLSDYFGRVRLFVWSIILFSIMSFLCGFSTSLTMLVICRVLQGAVAGCLIPLSQSLITTSNPPENQGAALGFWGMIVVVAPILGPIIGGYLTDQYSWPWIFYINVPIGFFSAGVTWYFLKDKESQIVRNPIDWVGLFLLSVGVACCQVMLDKGKDLDWFDSNIIITLTAVSIISLLYFALWTLSQKYPIVDFTFFKYRNFTLGTFCITIGYLIFFGSTVTIPLWLQTQQNYTPFWAGIAVAPIGIPPFLFSTTMGRNMHKIDLRYWTMLSFSLFAVGLFYQANFTPQVNLGTVMMARFLQGFGLIFFFLPLLQLSIGEIPPTKYASASGLFHFIRILVGSGFGTSLSIQLWTHMEIFHHAYLTEALTKYQQTVQTAYESLKSLSDVFISERGLQLLDLKVEQQSFTLATNDLSWLGAWMYLALIPIVFFLRPVRSVPKADVAH